MVQWMYISKIKSRLRTFWCFPHWGVAFQQATELQLNCFIQTAAFKCKIFRFELVTMYEKTLCESVIEVCKWVLLSRVRVSQLSSAPVQLQPGPLGFPIQCDWAGLGEEADCVFTMTVRHTQKCTANAFSLGRLSHHTQFPDLAVSNLHIPELKLLFSKIG